MDFESSLLASAATREEAQVRVTEVEAACRKRFGRSVQEELQALPEAELGQWVRLGVFLRQFSRTFDPKKEKLARFSDCYFHLSWYKACEKLPEEKRTLVAKLVGLEEARDRQQRTLILMGGGWTVNAETLAAKAREYQEFPEVLSELVRVLELGCAYNRDGLVYWTWTLQHAPEKTLYYEGLQDLLTEDLHGDSLRMPPEVFQTFRCWLGIIFGLDYVDESISSEPMVIRGVSRLSKQ